VGGGITIKRWKIWATTVAIFVLIGVLAGCTGRGEAEPTPTPGGRIAFASNRDGNDEIYVMDADGSNQTNLTKNSAGDFYPSWSP